MDNILLSVIAFICIVIAYVYKHLTTKNFKNVLIFWSITLVMFANFAITTSLTQEHNNLEKIMFIVIFCGPLSVIYRIHKKGSLIQLFFIEKNALKKSLPNIIYYLLYTVLSLGIILLITFSILNIFILENSIFVATIVNRITIALDWSIFLLLIIEILTNSEHEEYYFFWVMCLIAGIIFLSVQHNIHGDNFFNIPAIEPTINSICCSLAAIISIIVSKLKYRKTAISWVNRKKPALWAGFSLFIFSFLL